MLFNVPPRRHDPQAPRKQLRRLLEQGIKHGLCLHNYGEHVVSPACVRLGSFGSVTADIPGPEMARHLAVRNRQCIQSRQVNPEGQTGVPDLPKSCHGNRARGRKYRTEGTVWG
ncbi:hypothetical protein PoB_002638200 [Plakobranchus ocellatus]|uniref:Uncharacterized protein n=1 Tax=Plakobranchus ocellatus TaxID=259542 RepID=A0AAV3ZZ76_9GAST|nr:hypothetical protein PoB_002638200 [Plakobranchus ocellatus]